MGKDLNGRELGVGLRQRQDGRYSGRYVNKFGERKELYDSDLNVLRQRLAKAIEDDKIGIVNENEAITLSQWFVHWIEIHKYKVIRESTSTHYRELFEKHIEPKLGKRRLTDINQLHIKMLLRDLDKRGYGYATKNRVRIMLLDMFDKALIDNFVTRNPARGIKVIREDEKEMRVLTPEEQAEFFECSKGTFYDNLFVVSICTGLRQGEVCALTWDDINLEKKEISVNKTLLYQRLHGEDHKTYHFNPPKTKASKRTIPINKQCELALKKQFIQRNNIMAKRTAKPLKGFDNLLFVTKYGTPINDQIYVPAIHKIIDEINLCRDELEKFEYFSPHCFRHSFACRCFEAGIPPKTVQRYLGHASIQMTLDLYTHVLPNKMQEDMEKLTEKMDQLIDTSDEYVEHSFEKAMKKKKKVVNVNFSSVV